MGNIKVLFGLAVIMKIALLTTAVAPMGPATIKMGRMDECDDPDKYLNKFDYKVYPINRTHVAFSGCTELPHEVDITYIMNVTVAKWGDGGWKTNAFNHVEDDPCFKAINSPIADFWVSILRAINAKETCPTPAGRYCMKNYIAPLEGMFDNMLYGKFRIDFMLFRMEEPIMCNRLYADSIPSKVSSSPPGSPKSLS